MTWLALGACFREEIGPLQRLTARGQAVLEWAQTPSSAAIHVDNSCVWTSIQRAQVIRVLVSPVPGGIGAPG